MIDRFSVKGNYLNLKGKAYDVDHKPSNKKLCFVATDKQFLMGLLIELSELKQCYFVKLSSKSRNGMYLGRCFFTSDDLSAKYWAKYKLHPKVMCTLQDDDFTESYRQYVESYETYKFDYAGSGV